MLNVYYNFCSNGYLMVSITEQDLYSRTQLFLEEGLEFMLLKLV